MVKRTVEFIHDLRIFLFALIIVSFLYNLGANPIEIGKYISIKVIQAVGIGTSTTVPPNPINTLAAQLKEKESALARREAALDDMEKEKTAAGISQLNLLYGISIGIIILFILLVINFYLDFKTRNKNHEK